MRINQTFLEKPGTSFDTRRLDLGSFKTDVDEKRRLHPANKNRLEILNRLQRFGSVDWKEVRYSKALISFLASPGFTDLRLNKELCYLDRKKDLLLPVDRILGSLCNAVLEQKELLQNGLQGIVDWAFANPTNLSPEALFDRLSSVFGPGSQISKTSDQILQTICGKRAETIEGRRERLFGELPIKTTQSALRKIPLSAEYLFEKESLQALIQSLGGSQIWLNFPSYLSSKKPLIRKDTIQPISNHSFRTGRTSQNSREAFITQRNPFKVRGRIKKESRGKSEDFSRKKTDK